MSFSVAIVGLPNVGKSTLFKALTRKDVAITPRPFTTINPNIGNVSVPDERLDKLSFIIKPEKTTPTIIEFVDVAGLVKGAHKGEGLGNQFLAQIRECDAILEVVRVFTNPSVENVLGEINPKKEIEIVKLELLMKDLETLEKTIEKLDKKTNQPTLGRENIKRIELLEKVKSGVSAGRLISEEDLTKDEKLELEYYQFLTSKPVLYILNDDNKSEFPDFNHNHLVINLKEEDEMSDLTESERKELKLESKLGKLILSCYDILNLITFFTVAGGKEVRAWTAVKGSSAQEAGGIIHSDFKEKFIKANVIGWEQLVFLGSWQKAREKGLIKTVGKDYIVQNGDVLEFKI